MLQAAADLQPRWEFVDQDVDLRCVRMTAINLELRNLYGYVIWGDSLAAGNCLYDEVCARTARNVGQPKRRHGQESVATVLSG